jgi:hypothetical protein
VTDRFWSKVDRSGGPDACWPWMAYRNRDGYGSFRVDDHTESAHRVAWVEENGPVPEGMDVLHHCDNPPCCNPRHLFLGTAADNARDSVAKGRHQAARKTHCRRGHPFDGTNLIIDPRNGKRSCRIYRNERQRARRADNLEIARAAAREYAHARRIANPERVRTEWNDWRANNLVHRRAYERARYTRQKAS